VVSVGPNNLFTNSENEVENIAHKKSRDLAAAQHPHRAGKIRRPRQFSTALEIISGKEVEESAEDSGSQLAQTRCDTRLENEQFNQAQVDIEEADDDNCDDLLSFVAFGNKRRQIN